MENSDKNASDLRFNFSIDRGGTFTDVYCDIEDKRTNKRSSSIMKLLSVDPKNYEDAPTEGIRRILEQCTGHKIQKGT